MNAASLIAVCASASDIGFALPVGSRDANVIAMSVGVSR